jgi:hypothetical protein
MTVLEILEAYGKIGVQRIKQALEQVRATGKTINSVKYETSENNGVARLVIKARPYTSAIETGVKPVSAGSKPGIPPEMIANLTEYAQARGMEKPESAAWGIAKKIKQVGDKTYRMGGRTIYSDDVINLVNEIKKEAKKEYSIRFTTFIKNTWASQ